MWTCDPRLVAEFELIREIFQICYFIDDVTPKWEKANRQVQGKSS